ncbi:MAG: hypothetical protein WDW38_001037 [Sanguina aurantia]
MNGGGGAPPKQQAAVDQVTYQNMWSSGLGCGFFKCVFLNAEEIQVQRLTLRTVVEFGTLLVWFFLADRTTVIGEGPKSYNRDQFVFLFLILTMVAAGCSTTVLKVPALLPRQQTEEWKGMMQVLFLLYHYFEAKEMYNAIRVFIAAYVWMTGFGNFSYYYKTSDFSIGRFAQMMWRLNFLVLFSCIVMGDSYMLYYICPMHTIFTVMVYAALALAPALNKSTAGVLFKFVTCIALVLLLWEKRVFYATWTPFTWLVGYSDPHKPGGDALYEWYFRTSLDRYIWIYGMVCAFVQPHAAAALKYVDSMTVVRRYIARCALVAACFAAGHAWFVQVYCLPKLEYNAVHPYTSWIPITLFLILRNLTPSLRLHHMRLYGWLGCITLETYISQFHVWLRTGYSNGQPKLLMVLLPGYPLLNFALVTAGYVLVSHRLFEITNTLKNVAVPHSHNSKLARNLLVMAGAGGALFVGVAAAAYLAAAVV